MSKRENRALCMLAKTYERSKDRSAGMYLSTKLDGMRCLWMPATRGLKVSAIPFANTDKKVKDATASGLWSRYGNPIFAPEFFVVGFPNYPLDGELYLGNKKFEETMSIVKKHEPVEAEWLRMKYMVFEQPRYTDIFETGRINDTQYKKNMVLEDNLLALGLPEEPPKERVFDFTYKIMNRDLQRTTFLHLHEQRLLPFHTEQACKIIDEELERVTDAGGEGLMLRHPASQWEPIRSRFLLKIKKLQDAEALVVGYRAGQGKFLGMLGSLTVRWEHGEFELSGMDDAHRALTPTAVEWAINNPGELFARDDAPSRVSDVFPPNTVVTFRYRELSAAKAPKEGRFLRKYQ